MTKVTYKKLTSEKDWQTVFDLDIIAAKSCSYYLALNSIEEEKKFIGNSIVYILYDDNMPIGHIEYDIKKDKKTAEVTGYVVIPEYQGRGIGTKALQFIIDEANNVGVNKMYLMTHPENSKALRIYLNLGFKIRSWHDNFYGNGQPRLRLEKK